MPELTIGKMRGLQQCSTPRRSLAVLALDHRNNLKNALRPQDPQSVTAEEMVQFKLEVSAILAPAASAILLDPEVGGAQAIAAGALPGNIGLVMALDETGYVGDPTARQSQILPGWNAAKARQMGASAAKLLVYYHPDSPLAGQIDEMVVETARACQEQDLPFFLEPLSYSLDPQRKGLTGEERKRVVLETARRLTVPGVDVLKAEFPLDIKVQPDERDWAAACAALTQASKAPWILLSASAPYEVYLRQVEIALQEGSSGVAVGRAVWQEAPALVGAARLDFLKTVAYERLQRLTELCDALGRPWHTLLHAPAVSSTWYQSY